MNKLNLIHSIVELDKVLSKGSIIYGAGMVATNILRYAKENDFVIDKIVVSEKNKNPDEKCGITVCAIDEIREEINDKIILVCTLEDKHESISKKLTQHNLHEVYYISNSLHKKVVREKEDRNIILREMQKLKCNINSYKKFISKPCLEVLVVNIVDHCNLKCKGCDHFACIAEPYFVPYETIKADLEQMSKILKGSHIIRLVIEGGEALLHPDLLNIVKVARACFPDIHIRLVSNGVFLKKQQDEFWRVFRENNIGIWVTRYPINLDFEGMEARALAEKVEFKFWRESKMCKKVVDLNGENDPVERFANCYLSNYGNFLMEGKFYGCPFSCQSYRIFNKAFRTNLIMNESDYLDIYKVNDMQELFDFAAKPKFYCRYCNGNSEKFEWAQSKGIMEEWVNM